MDKLNAWQQIEGLSDAQLAKMLSVDRSYIWQMRTGKRAVTDAIKWRFARRFGYELAVKLFENGEDK